MKEKMIALTMIKEGTSIAHTATDLHVSKLAIADLKYAAKGRPDNTTPTNKKRTKTKTTDGTNAVLPRDMMQPLSITTANIKKKQPMLLQDIFIR